MAPLPGWNWVAVGQGSERELGQEKTSVTHETFTTRARVTEYSQRGLAWYKRIPGVPMVLACLFRCNDEPLYGNGINRRGLIAHTKGQGGCWMRGRHEGETGYIAAQRSSFAIPGLWQGLGHTPWTLRSASILLGRTRLGCSDQH